MTGRFGPAAIAALLLVRTLAAQQAVPLRPATGPTPPQPLPPAVTQLPGEAQPEARLPREEEWQAINPQTVRVLRTNGSWQVYVGPAPFRDFGNDADAAREVARVLRDLHVTRWTAIGTDRPVVEYGLTVNEVGRPDVPRPGVFPGRAAGIDLRTVRAEQVRGVWCLRDDANILLNFGPHRADAKQAAAVVRKYGFNRLGMVGRADPVLTYFFAQLEVGPAAPAAGLPGAQEMALTRTGIEVPGVGYVGEKVAIDPRGVEVRRERGEYVLASGREVIGRFGGSEWAARDAVRVVQEIGATEFCRFGTAGVTFFLVNGQAPRQAPFFTQGLRFNPAGLRVREMAGKWWVYDGVGRSLFPAGSPEEAQQLVSLVKAYGFDQLCQVGTSPRATLKFLAKSR